MQKENAQKNTGHTDVVCANTRATLCDILTVFDEAMAGKSLEKACKEKGLDCENVRNLLFSANLATCRIGMPEAGLKRSSEAVRLLCESEREGEEEGAVPIEALGLENRTAKLLRLAGIWSLRGVLTTSDAELLKIQRMGERQICRLRRRCEKYIQTHPEATIPEEEDRSCPKLPCKMALDKEGVLAVYDKFYIRDQETPEDALETINYYLENLASTHDRTLILAKFGVKENGTHMTNAEIKELFS